MDGRGEHWPGKHPGYPPGMLHPKFLPKGQSFPMPVMQHQNLYLRGVPNPGVMMHGHQAMPRMQPPMSTKYQDVGGHMSNMMMPPGSAYVQQGMNLSPRGAMKKIPLPEQMQGHSQQMPQGGSPVTVTQQMMFKRPIPGSPQRSNMVKAPTLSPRTQMGHMGGAMHGGLSPRGSVHGSSPRSMSGQLPPPSSNVPSNLSPKAMVHRLSPESYRHSGNMVMQQNSAKMQPFGPPMGMKRPPPMVQGNMSFGQMLPGAKSQISIHAKMMGMSIGKMGHSQLKSSPTMMMQQPPMMVAPPSHSPTNDTLPKHFSNLPKRFTHIQAQRPSQVPLEAVAAPNVTMESDPIGAIDVEKREQEKQKIKERMRAMLSTLVKEQLTEAEGLYGAAFDLPDEPGVIDSMIKGFLPIMDILWYEAKKSHKYSLDDIYMELSTSEGNNGKLFTLNRDMEHLEEYYRCKEEIENFLGTYHKPTKPVPKDHLSPPTEETEMTPLMKAQEYADVGYNQRQLVQKVTAIDYRNALWGEECSNLLPESFRVQQIKMIANLHFDILTPPQCVSPPTETIQDISAEKDLMCGANSTESINFSSVVSKLLEKQSSSQASKMPELPVLKLDMRYAKGPQVVPTPEMLMQISGYNQHPPGVPMLFRKGMNFPMVPMPKMMPMRSKTSLQQVPPLYPKAKRESNITPPSIDPAMMKKPSGIYGVNFKQ